MQVTYIHVTVKYDGKKNEAASVIEQDKEDCQTISKENVESVIAKNDLINGKNNEPEECSLKQDRYDCQTTSRENTESIIASNN